MKADAANAKASKSTCTPLKDKPMVKLHTNHGIITIQLDKEKAPLSSENFVKYVEAGFYNGTIFHRVINNFMIQGGGFTADMQQKPTRPAIQNEAKNGLKNDIYTVAMARTPNPHSATAQFFINVKNNDFLNFPGQDGWGYAVFGKVVEGMDVVDKIKAVRTGVKGGMPDVPVETVTIEKAECV
jgi:peptidyl-prolyl cis-trans isomerase B (cyclophilin B)